MFRGCCSLIWRLLWPARVLSRYVGYILILTLPVYILPLTAGLIEGFWFGGIARHASREGLVNFAENIRSATSMDFFSVPGAPGIHDVAKTPFHLVEVSNPLDWWKKLGLARLDIGPNGENIKTAENLASLTKLYRKKLIGDHPEKSWHHWLYISPSHFLMDGILFDEWDAAFEELIRYHYANTPANDAEFNYMKCPGRYLCDVWLTKGPSLLHFTTAKSNEYLGEVQADGDQRGGSIASVEKEEEEEEETPNGYEKVAVRVIELPLTELNTGGIPIVPGMFPSRFEQLRSITSSSYLWEAYAPHDWTSQLLLRMEDCSEDMERAYSQTFGRLRSAQTSVRTWLGLEESAWAHEIPELIGVAATGLTTVVLLTLYDKVFGDGGRMAAAHSALRGALRRSPTNNLMGQMLGSFIESLPKEAKDMLDSPEGKEAMEQMAKIVSIPMGPIGELEPEPEPEPGLEADK